MLRTRTIASAPARSTSQTWAAISKLITDTLERSPHIQRAEVEAVLRAAHGAGLALISGGHLERHDLVVVAGPMHLAIRTISGTAALTQEENLNPVPGAATATTWMLHLPAPAPVTGHIEAVADSSPHLTTEPPAGTSSALVATMGLDLAAVAQRLGGGA